VLRHGAKSAATGGKEYGGPGGAYDEKSHDARGRSAMALLLGKHRDKRRPRTAD
jgi:hypothetical protein